MSPDDFRILTAVIITVCICATFVLSNWMRMRRGYPIESTLGIPMHPRRDAEMEERVRLMTQENAQLRAELGSLKDRMATIERIVTDGSYRLDREIESLRGAVN